MDAYKICLKDMPDVDKSFILYLTGWLDDPIIGSGTCLKVGGPRKIVTEMHVQMRAGNDCNYSRYCLMFLFN